MSLQDGPRFVYRPEVARLMGVDPKTVSNLERRGAIPPAKRFGRRLAWHRETILAFLGLAANVAAA